MLCSISPRRDAISVFHSLITEFQQQEKAQFCEILQIWQEKLFDQTDILKKYTCHEEIKMYWLFNAQVIKSYVLLECCIKNVFIAAKNVKKNKS